MRTFRLCATLSTREFFGEIGFTKQSPKFTSPLIFILQNLQKQALSSPRDECIASSFAEMLVDPLLQERYTQHLEKRLFRLKKKLIAPGARPTNYAPLQKYVSR